MAPGTAFAAVSATAPVVINEVFGGGGNAGAPYNQDFVELRNTSAAPVDLSGWSVQYRGATAASWSGVIPLSGTVAPGGYYLVGAGTGANGAALPTPNAQNTSVAMSATNGNVALVSSTAALDCAATPASCQSHANVVDLVGFGTGNAFAGTGAAPAPSNTTSIARNATSANSANNAADFTAGAPTPAAGATGPVDPGDPSVLRTIPEVRGIASGAVKTRGVVTAVYPTGGFAGYVIQTPGSGADNTGRTVSDAIFIYSAATVGEVVVGDHVEVVGTVGEFNGLKQITVPSGGMTALTDPVDPVVPAAIELPAAAQREAYESMLLAPQGDFTISNTYSTNQYGEIGLAAGTQPLIQPTQVGAPGSPEAAAQVADNAVRGIVLDDGSSTNFLGAGNGGLTPPYISTTDPIRVGAAVTFTDPVILDWRNNTWKLNPTTHVTPADTSAYPATFENTRTAAPDAAAIGDADLTVASFNVLNYFTTLGQDTAGCVPYRNAAGDPVTVDDGCNPRGAWRTADFQRQQEKLVAAINATDASVVGLMEIENSAKLGETPDEATASLVTALNTAAGSTKWDFVPSSTDLPPLANQDVITNAIIFQPAEVTRDGDSRALGNLSASGQPFVNAREPIAQSFLPADGGESVFVVVNHFKSKGSAGPLPGDGDLGDGQGNANASRKAQATALRDWLPTVTEEGDAIALLGDFNSYAMEDPLRILYDDGFVNVETEFDDVGYSYSFQGLSGSLDHVLLNEAARARTTGADIWNINSGESLALEYSRFGYHGTTYHDPGPFRSSDHDPVVVGMTAGAAEPETALVSFLNINDFHGRIDTNTVKVAGTIEQQRKAVADAGGESLFLSAGDNIGASLFASATQQDQPTIDVLNALDLAASAVGNHEFDGGYDDLVDRVIDGGDNAEFAYLGANVRHADGTPALQEYSLHEAGGLTVAVIGVVTEETPTLVSPAGVADLTFTDPVEAVNRIAGQLTDGDPANDEADIIVAEYHEGAGAGIPDGSTLEQEVAAGGMFASIVEDTSAAVDVIFTGHTHKQYAWDAPVPGVAGKTRPILQTGNYGEFIGRVDLTVDADSGDVSAYTATNVARATTADADLVAAFPRVAAVKPIVDAALAHAAAVGNEPVGSVTADITTAYSGGSYVAGKYTGSGPLPSTGRDDRSKESSLGNLIADSLVHSLGAPERGGATIGVVNPGGMRNELYFAPDGVITYAEANAVLPFVNNLWTTTLTGDQVKVMLEQQWQTNADGTIPSRPYLQLGLSENVTYTFDATRPMGDRITSITVDGAPIDPAGEYRIGTFSFLATGGDNFRVFKEGTNTRDSGLVDRDAWIDFLETSSPVSPTFARHAVAVPELAPAQPGSTVTFTVGQLDLTSLGAPQNTTVNVSLDGVDLGDFPVTGGSATVEVDLPADATSGEHQLLVTAAPSGTQVHVPLTIDGPSTVGLSFLNINDFHGRIDANTVKVAGTIEQQRKAIEAAGGEALFLSAGDNIGASLFASAVAKDQPTIDVLNALDLAASAVGNHEFDLGYDDLVERVIDGGDNAEFAYLGANVRNADGTPALQEYSLHEVNGLTVAVIGVVTEETPSLVTPAGVAGLTFGDPVEAVNRVAAQLTDGDPANDEADIIVAEYHEGAGAGIPDGSTLEQEVAAGGMFAAIVEDTSAAVDVIFTGHTHKQYAWDAPVPGVAGKTRPVLQTGSYGEFIGRVDLTVDADSGDVSAYTATNVARTTVADATLVAEFPRVAEVKPIVDAALAAATIIGGQGVGSVTADITTAYSGGSYVDGKYKGSGPLPSTGRDDRSKESALGNLVANSLVDSLSAPERGGATIGVVNPGGLRNELFKGGNSVITYAAANAVLPFVNNLWTTTLTGDQFKVMLEQQWQTNADGTIPSRPYLQLGLSDNVSYTYDASRPMGDRITSITVDGQPIDPAADYRIGTFSFLATGGDNFRIFTQGTDTRDSGLVDRDAWIEYLGKSSPVSPSFARHAVGVPEVAPVKAGGDVEIPVTGLDLTSLGSPRNLMATATLEGAVVGNFPVTNGATTLHVEIPRTLAAGEYDLTIQVAPSNTLVHVPLTVEAGFTFLDVPEGMQFIDEISWLAARGITTGYDAAGGKEFRPLNPVNRDAMAAFLYRLAGEPEFTPPATSPFTDVTPTTQFYKEITWLAAEEISTGYDVAGGKEFRPLNPVNRDAMAAFMYRFAGEPAYTAPTTSRFLDVTPSTQFYKEISWLAANGISTGYDVAGGKEFRPLNAVNRDAMAAFMYRFDHLS